jgi:hypothetical protein
VSQRSDNTFINSSVMIFDLVSYSAGRRWIPERGSSKLFSTDLSLILANPERVSMWITFVSLRVLFPRLFPNSAALCACHSWKFRVFLFAFPENSFYFREDFKHIFYTSKFQVAIFAISSVLMYGPGHSLPEWIQLCGIMWSLSIGILYSSQSV